MAVDVCSDISSLSISPRISFSHDLNQTNSSVSRDQILSDPTLLDSSSDFNFCIVNNLTLELSSAEELFSNGKILPIQIKKNITSSSSSKHDQPREPRPSSAAAPRRNSSTESSNTEKKRLKEFLASNFDTDDEEKPPPSKSFWQFRRSSSLNFETVRGKSLIQSLHFLSRSNSTGSAPTQKQSSAIRKENKKQNLQKQSSVGRSRYRRSSSCPNAAFYNNSYSVNSTQKPCLRKNFGSQSNGVRVSPVLNLPHPYISKVTISFFSFGSLFCNGKDRKKKK